MRGGGIVAFPTETVYGLGAVATDARAVTRVFEAKGRPSFDPLIVHVLDDEMLAGVVSAVPASARVLIERFWPGPLTLVLSRAQRIPLVVTAGMETVAVRSPSHDVARALLAQTRLPIAAPSANAFGALSPTRAEHVVHSLGDRVALVLDAGATTLGLESTIVRLEPQPALLRPGALPVEEIEAAIGPVERIVRHECSAAPGRLEHHYAPRTRLRIARAADVPLEQRAGVAYLGWTESAEGYAASRVLSTQGSLREAAARLFECLYELDALECTRIDAEPVDEGGLGLAIMDRLRRAAT